MEALLHPSNDHHVYILKSFRVGASATEASRFFQLMGKFNIVAFKEQTPRVLNVSILGRIYYLIQFH